MKLIKEAIIIGGLPNPIGGVTTFLSRLVKAYPQYVIVLLDLYPNSEKRIPDNFRGIYKLASSKIVALIMLYKLQLSYKGKELFFNFSSGNSLIFFLFLPKINNEWTLMLHHGHLASKLPKFILRFILSKFNKVYVLNDRQALFFKDIDPKINIIKESSYVPATLVDIPGHEKQPLLDIKELNYKVVVGSGFPRPLYQHHLLIEVIEKISDAYLFLFLYGEGELKQELLNLEHPRVMVFLDKDEDIFNYYLSKADLYVRPTLEDSFGIACADAVEFGVPVVASNVCKRYSGVFTYELNSNQEFYELSNKFL